jgi:hypothetical protein
MKALVTGSRQFDVDRKSMEEAIIEQVKASGIESTEELVSILERIAEGFKARSSFEQIKLRLGEENESTSNGN